MQQKQQGDKFYLHDGWDFSNFLFGYVNQSKDKDLTLGSDDLQTHSERKLGFNHEQIQKNKD